MPEDTRFRLYGNDGSTRQDVTFAHEQRMRFYLFLLFVAAIVFVLMRENLNLSSELQSANSRLEEKQQVIDKLNSEAAGAQIVTAPPSVLPSDPPPAKPSKGRRKKARFSSQDAQRAVGDSPSAVVLEKVKEGKDWNE